MNRVAVSAASFDGVPETPDPRWGKSFGKAAGEAAGKAAGFARKVLVRLGRDKWDLSVLLCGDKTITCLNSQYRGKAEATDILSFALEEGEEFPGPGGGRNRRLPGDIVISLDTLRENARRFGISEDEELRRLLIHGILHLDGMDHKTNKETEPMLQLQEKMLADLGGRILPKVRLSGGIKM
jgi:probable rRNA maturation factor